MPVLAVHLDQKLYASACDLVARGGYRDFQQLVDVAVRNQLAMEDGYGTDGILSNVSDKGSVWAVSGSSKREAKRAKEEALKPKPPVSSTDEAVSVSSVFVPFQFQDQDGKGPDPCAASVRPADEQMYSLINRLFPIKLMARWLEVEAARTGAWPMLDDLLPRLGHDVAAFGSHAWQIDLSANRRRDEQLATALPRLENPGSINRFLTQFAVRRTDSGEVYPGGIIQFSFASVKNTRLVLTAEGRALSRLPNVLIDGVDESASDALSELERESFLSQVWKFMPAEASNFEAVLRAVAQGVISPSELVQYLRQSSGERDSDAAFRSHLSGIVARLVDLKLLQRKWEGRNVFYSVTAQGRAIVVDRGAKEGSAK